MTEYDPRRTSARLFSWEEERKLGTQLPVWRTGWVYCIVIGGDRGTYGLVTYFEHATEAATNWYNPLLARCR